MAPEEIDEKNKKTENFISGTAMLSIVVLALLFTSIASIYIFYYHLDDSHQDTDNWIFEIRRYVNYHLRIFLIMVRPFIDWSDIQGSASGCLLSTKTFMQTTKTTRKSSGNSANNEPGKCPVCREDKHRLKIFHDLPRKEDGSIDYEYSREMLYDLMRKGRPIVIDAQFNYISIQEWQIKKNTATIMDILDFYARHGMIEKVCHIETNLRPKSLQGLFVNLYTDRKRHIYESWYASWQNCRLWSKKMFRSMYDLSELKWLPLSMMEMSGSQSILASSLNSQTLTKNLFSNSSQPSDSSEEQDFVNYKRVPAQEDENMTFVFQIQGHSRLRLFAKCTQYKPIDCSKAGSSLVIDLSPNQAPRQLGCCLTQQPGATELVSINIGGQTLLLGEKRPTIWR